MHRYLLFDSGCNTCTRVAQAVEQETNSYLTARSLRDAEVQQMLTKLKPDWKWEPTLLEVDELGAHAYTGIGLRTRILLELGPRKAVRIARLVQRHTARDMSVSGVGRRHFLRRAAAVAGGVALASAGFQKHALAAAQPDVQWHIMSPQEVNVATASALRSEEVRRLVEYTQAHAFTALPRGSQGVAITHGGLPGHFLEMAYTGPNEGQSARIIHVTGRSDGAEKAALAIVQSMSGQMNIDVFETIGGSVTHTESSVVAQGVVTVHNLQSGTSRTATIPAAVTGGGGGGGSCSECESAFSFLEDMGCAVTSVLMCLVCGASGPVSPVCVLICGLFWALMCWYGDKYNSYAFCQYAGYC